MHEKLQQLYGVSSCDCDHHKLALNVDDESFDSKTLIKKALNNIYHKRVKEGDIDRNLFDAGNNPLQKGVDKTFSSVGIEFGKKNIEFINQFKYNTSIFAAFKAHAQQSDLSKLIMGEDGNPRSFHEFKKVAQPIIGKYNVRYLKVEYDTVVRSARTAVNLKKFEERKHIFPNLEFMPSRARDKRESHLSWVGTILPIEHPWWLTHMPPVDWGCQCWIRQTRAKPTDVPGETHIAPEVFRNNPGVSGEFIDINKHPYVANASISKDKVVDFLAKNETTIVGYTRQPGVGSNGGYLETV